MVLNMHSISHIFFAVIRKPIRKRLISIGGTKQNKVGLKDMNLKI